MHVAMNFSELIIRQHLSRLWIIIRYASHEDNATPKPLVVDGPRAVGMISKRADNPHAQVRASRGVGENIVGRVPCD